MKGVSTNWEVAKMVARRYGGLLHSDDPADYMHEVGRVLDTLRADGYRVVKLEQGALGDYDITEELT